MAPAPMQLAPTADNKRVGFPPNFDYNKQAVPVPGTKKPGQTGAPVASRGVYVCTMRRRLTVFARDSQHTIVMVRGSRLRQETNGNQC
jgi:hypothetical protein